MRWLYLFATVALAVCGQLLVKWRVDIHGPMPHGLQQKFTYFWLLLTDPPVIVAFCLAFLSALSWMATVAKFELNFVYPLLIVCLLVLTVLSSTLLLHESLSWSKVTGLMLIASGALVLVRWN